MHIEKLSEDLGRVSATGDMQPQALSDTATTALAIAHCEQVRALLVDFTGVHLSRALSMNEGYELGRHLAQAGAGLQRVAFVTPKHCIAPHKFALDVAANRGLDAAAFASEAEALRWLKAA